MNKMFLRILALVGVGMSTSAMAADMPVKYNPVPPPAFSWAGPYAGIALGWKWGDATWTTTSTSDLGGTIVDASSPAKFDPSAFRIGGYAGYNWQLGAFVYGAEFDIAFADNTASRVGLPGCSIMCFPGAPGPGIDTSSVKMGWDASARARIGYLVTPDILLFATGGIAWQSIETTGLCQHSLVDPACTVAAGAPLDLQTNSEVLTGWTIGAGFESKVYGNWLLRGEYRYSDFGNLHGVFNFAAPGVPAGADTHRYDLSVRTHIATIGLAYKF